MATDINEYNSNNKPTWCPGCGNFTIQMALKKALTELNLGPSQVYIAFDIGCNGNGADKINVYGFKGLHGRAIPLAAGAHLANRRYTVIADLGDGAAFHEGIDHLVHAIRSNYDITILIHNNENFALTTGQATVSTNEDKPVYGFPDSKPERSLNISNFILSQDPSFYARGYAGDIFQLTEIIKKGIEHKGCSIVEIMQLCPTYNPECNVPWFTQRIKKIDTPQTDILKAMQVSNMTKDSVPTGVLYTNDKIPTYYDSLENRKNSKTELVDEVQQYDIQKLFDQFK